MRSRPPYITWAWSLALDSGARYHTMNNASPRMVHSVISDLLHVEAGMEVWMQQFSLVSALLLSFESQTWPPFSLSWGPKRGEIWSHWTVPLKLLYVMMLFQSRRRHLICFSRPPGEWTATTSEKDDHHLWVRASPGQGARYRSKLLISTAIKRHPILRFLLKSLARNYRIKRYGKAFNSWPYVGWTMAAIGTTLSTSTITSATLHNDLLGYYIINPTSSEHLDLSWSFPSLLTSPVSTNFNL